MNKKPYINEQLHELSYQEWQECLEQARSVAKPVVRACRQIEQS